MSERALKHLFIWGSLFFLAVMIGLTVDSLVAISQRTPVVSEEVRAGKLVFQNKNCMDCHTILGNGAYYGADLTKVIDRRGEAFVRSLLKNPPAVTAGLWPGDYRRRMPDLNLTDQEIEQLIAFLTWTGKVDTNQWPPQPLRRAAVEVEEEPTREAEPRVALGKQVFQRENCGSCHALQAAGLNYTAAVGPDLTHEAQRGRSAEWLMRQLTEPTAIPDQEVAEGFAGKQSIMPSFKHLSEEELQALVEFLQSLE